MFGLVFRRTVAISIQPNQRDLKNFAEIAQVLGAISRAVKPFNAG
jgi:hypothetical protein